MYGALVHAFHAYKAVGTFDPRLQGGAIVSSHTPELRVGDVVSVADAKKVVVEPLAEEKAKVTA